MSIFVRLTGSLFHLVLGLALLGLALLPERANGQVDPQWLKHWNAAQTSRPETLLSTSRIADESEPGLPLRIEGQVFGPDGMAAEGVVIHVSHRDINGMDFGVADNTLPTWRLQGWALSNAKGQFRFDTTRPGADHLGREGAHFHFTLESKDYGRQWAPSVFLADDPVVTSAQRRKSQKMGRFGRVVEVKTQGGVQHVAVNLQLKAAADF